MAFRSKIGTPVQTELDFLVRGVGGSAGPQVLAGRREACGAAAGPISGAPRTVTGKQTQVPCGAPPSTPSVAPGGVLKHGGFAWPV